jgi:LysM repeat protein
VFRNGVVLEKAQTMKKIIVLSLVLISIIIIGCKPNTPPVADTHPANLVGKWKAEAMEKEAEVTIEITTETNGEAVFSGQTAYTIARGDSLPLIARAYSVPVNQILQANPGLTMFNLSVGEKILIQTETMSGTWKQTDDYLIIERPNGGFVAFRISSQSTNQLTVFARTGQTIQFNRIP